MFRRAVALVRDLSLFPPNCTGYRLHMMLTTDGASLPQQGYSTPKHLAALQGVWADPLHRQSSRRCGVIPVSKRFSSSTDIFSADIFSADILGSPAPRYLRGRVMAQTGHLPMCGFGLVF